MGAASSAAHVFKDPPVVNWKVARRPIPIDKKTVRVSSRSTNQVLTGTGIFAPPIRIRIQEIRSPRGSIGPHKVRNVQPFKNSINLFSPKHGHPTSIFSKVIGCKTVSDESADVNPCCGMDFRRNFVITNSPTFMDFRLSPTNKPDKIKSVIVPTTRFGRLANGSNWIWTWHDTEEVTVEIVSKKIAYSNYIFKNKFETMKEIQHFERGNISMT